MYSKQLGFMLGLLTFAALYITVVKTVPLVNPPRPPDEPDVTEEPDNEPEPGPACGTEACNEIFGYIQSCKSCEFYIWCLPGYIQGGVELRCPPGTVFDISRSSGFLCTTDKTRCKPGLIDQGTTLTPVPTTTEEKIIHCEQGENCCIRSCDGQDERFLYQSCTSCKEYIQCTHGNFNQRPCAPGTFFDVNEQICVHESSTCNADTLDSTTTSITTTQMTEEQTTVLNGEQTCNETTDKNECCVKHCENKPNGDYQSCLACNRFVTCSNGILYNRICADPDTYWSDDVKRCVRRSETKTCLPDCNEGKIRCCPEPGGTCKDDTERGFQCVCNPGYTGDGYICERIKSCDDYPCENGGVCIIATDGYPYCQCIDNYSGDMCEINSCDPNPCNNRGTCLRITNGYKCRCPNGFTGMNCDSDSCDPNPCNNMGNCSRTQDGHECDCPIGFTGQNCETDSCDPDPCNNMGNCSRTQDGHECDCPIGFTGQNCETDSCDPDPCNNMGNCSRTQDGHECDCPIGFTGQNCETDSCDPDPCNNMGNCSRTQDGHECDCPIGFTGQNCETDSCDPDPCNNMGNCSRTQDGHECDCPIGFTGQNCETDSCDPDPCNNMGNCSRTQDGHECDCPIGFTGQNCETDSCDPDPCNNSGTCIRITNGYKCECPNGFTGMNCDSVDKCALNPCLPEIATCTNQPGSADGFTCKCNSDHSGDGITTCEPMGECRAIKCEANRNNIRTCPLTQAGNNFNYVRLSENHSSGNPCYLGDTWVPVPNINSDHFNGVQVSDGCCGHFEFCQCARVVTTPCYIPAHKSSEKCFVDGAASILRVTRSNYLPACEIQGNLNITGQSITVSNDCQGDFTVCIFQVLEETFK